MRVAVNGGGGDEFLTVGPAYMADLLRSLNVVGAAQYVSNTLRSFSLHKRQLLQNLLWKFGVRSLAVSQGTRALRAVAPDVLRRRWRRRFLAVAPPWLAPDPGAPQGPRGAGGAPGGAATESQRPERALWVLLSGPARRIPASDAVVGSGGVVRQPAPSRSSGAAAVPGTATWSSSFSGHLPAS